ncbi:MAG: hypothetical protein Unbinned805contig1001_4 [Prokaryotic dsDNA virus sp.]|jgi:hypothetical protein|nr:MAG: hypothetical protein Unbinned805contig1001_4 [Prokaryotic dsDNA virus sp.]|tara:strand:- start:1321 stop:1725 length:405 start_codon:yes stop_codon:yes gene_type:complete
MRKIERKLAEQVMRLSGVNLFLKNRSREYVEARALYCYILRHYLKLSLRQIQSIFKFYGKSIHHSTILHLLNNWGVYTMYNKDLQRFAEQIMDNGDWENQDVKKAYIIDRIKILPEDTISEIYNLVKEDFELVT